MPSCYHHFLYYDILGITLVILGSTFYGVYVGFTCYPDIQWFYSILYGLLFIVILLPITILFPSKTSFKFKKWIMTLFVAAELIPAYHWIYLMIKYHTDVVYKFGWILISFFSCYGIGFIFWHFKIPECYYPGKFDIFGHSHQIWHIFTALAPFIWWIGQRNLLLYYLNDGCNTI